MSVILITGAATGIGKLSAMRLASPHRPREYQDHADIFVPHAYPEHNVDWGEIRINYIPAGNPENAGVAAGAKPDRFGVGPRPLRATSRT